MRNQSGQKKVSVIIPAFNSEQYIAAAIQSITDQEYENVEILVVDDHSSDNTGELIHELQQKHPEIIYMTNTGKKGPSGARNTGILNASGEYLAFLDADDVWLKGHLLSGMEIFNARPDIDVIFSDFNVVNYRSKEVQYNFFSQKKVLHGLRHEQISDGVKIIKDNLLLALVRENFFNLVGVILKKSACSNLLFDESVRFAEDRDFAIRLYKNHNATFAYRDTPQFIAYEHASNLYKNDDPQRWQEVYSSQINLYKKYLVEYDLHADETSFLREVIAGKMMTLAYLHARSKRFNETLSHMKESFIYAWTSEQFKILLKIIVSMVRARQ